MVFFTSDDDVNGDDGCEDAAADDDDVMSQGRGRGSRAAEKVRWNGNYLRLLILMRRKDQRDDH